MTMFKQIQRASLAAGLALALSAGAASAQDSFGYTASSSVPYSYVNIASSGAAVLAGADDGTAVIALPFPFRFYGATVSSICVSANGVVGVGGCPTGDMTNLDLTSQTPQGDTPLIAPFWMDLTLAVPGAGAIFYQTLGAAGSRQFVVQWNDVYALNAPGALNFQLVLSEADSAVLFQYQSVETASAAVSKGAGATVGIRAAGSAQNGRRLQWSYCMPVLRNGMAIRFAPPAANPAVDVSASIQATSSGLAYVRARGVYTGTITIRNIGAAAINRPLTIVLANLTAGVTATNATGSAPGQGPYYSVPGTLALQTGQSAVVAVEFKNPSNVKINYLVKTYSGTF